MTTPVIRAAWHGRAVCTDTDAYLFFGPNAEPARALCSRCPVRAECLYDALQHEAPSFRYGVWGGLSPAERAELPALTGSKPDDIATLRELLTTTIAAAPLPERTEQSMSSTQPVTTVSPATINGHAQPAKLSSDASQPDPAEAAEKLPVGKLLKWGAEHDDPGVRDQAARAQADLAGLRTRYATDRELAALASKRQELEQQLAELQARESELAPPKTKPRRKKQPGDYPPAVVRAWAHDNNVTCPSTGRVPKAVVEAWKQAGSPGGQP